MKVKIVIADDHDFFRQGLELVLSQHHDFSVVGNAINGRQLIEMARQHQPEIIITDITMPEISGIEATKSILHEFPFIKIIALTMHDDDTSIQKMLKAGALAYIDKNVNKTKLYETIEYVLKYNELYFSDEKIKEQYLHITNFKEKSSSKCIFTEREMQIIKLITEEKTIKEIATILQLSPRTIEGHRARIMKRINVKSISGVISYAFKHEILKD